MQKDFILLDRSGSMEGPMWREALGAINAYCDKLKADKIETEITVAVFDMTGAAVNFDVVRTNVRPESYYALSDVDAKPRGATPLNDAAGLLLDLAEAANADRTAIIIMTDGLENASKEHSTTAIKSRLDRARARNWQVIMLGAGFDNAAQARSYGNHVSQTAAVGEASLGLAGAKTGALRARYAATGAAMVYSDADKAELARGLTE
jgi:Mg-chelatase subunit ChlD